MRQFIKNNRPYAQTSREDFAQKYLSEGCEEVPVLYVQGNFIDAVWNGSEWIESATPEEIAEEKKSIYLERLQNYSIDLLLRAKASAIGKKGSRDYIFAQVEMYELKCKIAKGLVSGQYFTDLLTNEAIEFGLSIEDFKALIILRYDTTEATYQQFLFMIERCRTFIQTLIEKNNFTKVDSAFALIDTLDAPEQAQSLMASILEL